MPINLGMAKQTVVNVMEYYNGTRNDVCDAYVCDACGEAWKDHYELMQSEYNRAKKPIYNNASGKNREPMSENQN